MNTETSSHHWRIAIIGGATGLVAAAMIYILHPPSPLARLVAASPSSERRIEARLTGGFPYAPYHARRGSTLREPASMELMAGAAAVVADRHASAHAAGAALLLVGDTSRAAAMLSEVAAGRPDAAAWSDLAAAKYTAAMTGYVAAQLVDGLVAADSALALDGKLAEARFNRALIIERLGLRELALDAWKRYLEIDGGSEWAVEARTHTGRLAAAPRRFADELERMIGRIAAGDTTAVHDLGQRYPQEVRTWGETEILGRWAEGTIKGNGVAAERYLTVGRTFGDIAHDHGDAMLAGAARAIELADGGRRSVLASAHIVFRHAQRTFMDHNPAEAEQLFVRAADGFVRGGSPLALLARYFRANTAYEQGRIEEAETSLKEIAAEAPPDLRALRAQIEWELGLCSTAKARSGAAISHFSESIEIFDALGEGGNAATMREMLSEVFELIGDPSSAWNLRADALQQIGQSNTSRLQATLGSIAQTAILRNDWKSAASLLTLELDAARAAHSDAFAADALLRRALVAERLKDLRNARADLTEAQAHLANVQDRGFRSQLDGRLLWVESVLAPSAGERIGWLTRAIEFHTVNGRKLMLPRLFSERAQTRRVLGDVTGAAADLDAAIGELENHRESLPRGERRWGVYEASEDVFDEAIELALARGQIEKAFRYSERARATTLLDALRASSRASLVAIPKGTTVLEYAVLPKRVVIFAATEAVVQVASHSIDRAALVKDAARLQQGIIGDDDAIVGQTARSLYQALIEPIATSIAPNDRLIIVPDATLSSVPFAALCRSDGKFLVEQHSVVISPSASVFTHAANSHGNGGVHRTLIVVNGSAAGRDRLAEADAEAHAIKNLYGSAALLDGPRATGAAFTREARRADMIHFAGHALVSNTSAEETSLVLSDGHDGEENYDVRRIAAVDLGQAPIVVLAACSTARGRVTPLEGTMSVARAFLAAGSRSVVATLWPIDDHEAASFFVGLHAHLSRGEPPAEALRAAQIESIHGAGRPSMWAAVQVIGS